MKNTHLRSLYIGIKRRWKNGLIHAFSAISIIWLPKEIGTKISSKLNDLIVLNPIAYSLSILIIFIFTFMFYTYEVKSISFSTKTIDSIIRIKFGDLFDQDTDWIIGVNEFFDGKLGDIVSENSVHGQFISKIYNRDSDKFLSDTSSALSSIPFEETHRLIKPSRKYEIGTTAIIQDRERKVFLVAISNTDLETAKASSSVPLLWSAIEAVLTKVHHHGNGAPISMPLIGSGRSSVNISPQHLLRLLVLSLVDFGRKKGLPSEVTIILPEDRFDRLDILEIKRDWEK